MDIDNCRWCGRITTDYDEDLRVWLHPACAGDYYADLQPRHHGED